MGKTVFATFSTWVTPTVHLNRGEAWDADDPVVRSHPDWFTSDASEFARRSDAPYGEPAAVEQATAAPGEKRATRRARVQSDDA
jgi:hypothetical protein